MARLVVVIPESRAEALQGSGVFPLSWGVGARDAGADELPTIVTESELRKRLTANDETWLGRHFQSRGGSVLATWIAFVGEAGAEHGALHEVRSSQRRLETRLGEALGYRIDELNHLTVLVDDEADQGHDDDRKLVPRVRHAWGELRMRGPLFYMGPRLNSVEDVPLAAATAWPVAVGTLLLSLHVMERPATDLPSEGVHAWRGVAWRPWSPEEATRMRRELARHTSEALDPRVDSQDPDGRRSEDLLREELTRKGGLEIRAPRELARPAAEDGDGGDDEMALLRRFDESGSTSLFGESIRSTRESAATVDSERQQSLWTRGWAVAERHPLGARRARQIMDEIPVAGAGTEESATQAASRYSAVCAAEQQVREERALVGRCAEHIESAERGRLGPAARLGVAVAVVSLLSYAIWFLADGVLGLTGMATALIAAMSGGAAIAAATLTILESRALRSARESFDREMISDLYDARSAVAADRARIMGTASEQRFRDHDRSTRAALRAQLDRLGRIVDGALGLTREEDYASTGSAQAPDPRVSRCFVPSLFDVLPTMDDESVAEDPVRPSLGKTRERWERFVQEHDPYHRGDIPAARLATELGRETSRLRLEAFQRQITRIGVEVPDRLLRESKRVSSEPFISGLSHRQEGKQDQPLLWTSLIDEPALQRDWNVDEACADRLRALGFVGLRLDHQRLETRGDDPKPEAAR